MRYGCGMCVVALALSLNACGSGDVTGVIRTTPPPNDTSGISMPTEAEIRQYFLDVAFARTARIEKWTGPIHVAVRGARTSDTQDIALFLAELRTLTGLDITVVTASANFEVNYIPAAEWPYRTGGWTVLNGAITSGSVNVEQDASPNARRSALRQRFLMAMGFGRVDEPYPESIFALGTTASALTPYDREVVRRLYRPAVLPGMTRQEVVAALGY